MKRYKITIERNGIKLTNRTLVDCKDLSEAKEKAQYLFTLVTNCEFSEIGFTDCVTIENEDDEDVCFTAFDIESNKIEIFWETVEE